MSETGAFTGEIWRQPYTAQQLQDAAANQVPYIGEDGNWYRWNIGSGQFDDTGVSADPSAESRATACDPDNWYFPSAAVINQRGVSGTISTPGYFIDRWKLTSGNVAISSTGLTLNGSIAQIVDNAYPNIRAVTALATDGSLIDGVWDASTNTVSYSASGKTIRAVDFAPGDVPIRFRKSGGVWDLVSSAPNFQAELSKCQRYYWQWALPTYIGFALGVTDSATSALAVIRTPVPMRIAPTITFDGDIYLSAFSAGTQYYTLSPTAQWVRNTHFTTKATRSDLSMPVGIPVVLHSNNLVIKCSADL